MPPLSVDNKIYAMVTSNQTPCFVKSRGILARHALDYLKPYMIQIYNHEDR